jgi:ADP-heptose:LPS heptosyltransferase
MRDSLDASDQGTQPIVIYRLGSLGDTVVALPCFHKIAERYPSSKRFVLTNFPESSKAAPLEVILGNSGLIHGTIAYPPYTRSIKTLLQLTWSLRSLRASTLIYLTPPRGWVAALRDYLFFRTCGFTEIIGLPLSRDLQYGLTDPETGTVERECERLVRSIRKLGDIDLHQTSYWDLRLTPEEDRVGASVVAPADGRPIIAINVGGKVLKNDWGEANWSALLTRLAASYADHALLIVGSKEDHDRSARLVAVWPSHALNMCGKLTPRESAGALRRVQIFIGHDSGPLHLAAAMGVSCVGLYGDYNPPRKWHPVGERHRSIHRMSGVMSISTEDVLNAVHSIFAAEAQKVD